MRKPDPVLWFAFALPHLDLHFWPATVVLISLTHATKPANLINRFVSFSIIFFLGQVLRYRGVHFLVRSDCLADGRCCGLFRWRPLLRVSRLVFRIGSYGWQAKSNHGCGAFWERSCSTCHNCLFKERGRNIGWGFCTCPWMCYCREELTFNILLNPAGFAGTDLSLPQNAAPHFALRRILISFYPTWWHFCSLLIGISVASKR